MSTFLGELAQSVIERYSDQLSEVQLVFPNRRAGVFFRKELGKLIDKPIWLPKIYSMEDFVVGRSELSQIDKLEAVFLLYEIYQKHQPEAEHFDKFYFWGEMIFKDFEEIDHYRVGAEKLFTTIRSQKELDEAFYFLDEEDRRIIEEFWNTFLPDIDDAQASFLKTWEILFPVYQQFREQLIEEGKGYNGLIYRQIAEKLEAGEKLFEGPIVFAGFNALTAAEETIIGWCVENLEAQVHWDLDAYYVEPKVQEAGLFFREYRSKAPLSKTFPKELPNRFEQKKEIAVTGVPLEVGQTKAMISRLEELSQQLDFEPEKTVVVLPHEYMLHPVLHAIPDSIELLNITMGYPLNASNTFGLIDSLLKLQHNHRNHLVNGLSFYHKPLLELLDHPLIQPLDEKGITDTVKQIKKRNLIYVYTEEISTKHPLIHYLLTLHEDALEFLLDVLSRLDKVWQDKGHDFELEFIRRYYKTYAQLKQMLQGRGEKLGYEFLIRLHRRISGSLKVPFTGEPLNGLQVMGILETRNLDFDHVLVVNMNEDSWPAPAQRGSFVPFNIRKAFDMPVHDHQDAIYSYLFYRLLQRAKTADFYYNTVSEFSMNGEPSRLLQQLELESLHVLDKRLLVNPITVAPPKKIEIAKSERIYDRLNRFVEGAPLPKGAQFHSRLTPSALESYLYCRLRFYFRYVEELYEQDELQEEMDAMIFGNILHDAMEELYKDHLKSKGTSLVSEVDFFALETAVDGAINRAFVKQYRYKDTRKFQLEGRSVIAYEVIRKMVLRILQIDKQHTPFEIIGLEADTKEGYARNFEVEAGDRTINVRLKGKIDRIDRKDGVIRIVDYKTGKDEKQFASVESLTDRENDKRNKAAFQVLFYSWIVKNSELYDGVAPIEPGLFNNKDLFRKDFDWKIFQKEGRGAAQPVHDFRDYEEAFEEGLRGVLTEIWHPEVAFDQVADAKKCQYCPYKGICGR
jgi:CRISPR/Cas system-associated exonuclease Cas4 (RecB family)